MSVESLPLALGAWFALVILLAGLSQGALGFGFPVIATPLIALATDMRTAIIVVLLPTLATILVALFSSGPLSAMLARFWRMPLYAVLGSVAGTWLFVSAPDAPYSLVLAALTLTYLGLDRLGQTYWSLVSRHEPRIAPLAGIASGIFEGTANVAAPPLIIFYIALGLAPAMMVQAMNICFLVGKSTQFAVLTLRGGIGPGEWLATLPFVVIGVAGSLMGVRLRNHIDAATFRRWVKGGLLVIALGLIAQYVYSLVA